MAQRLARWYVQKGEFLGKTFLSVPPASKMAKQILADIGFPAP